MLIASICANPKPRCWYAQLIHVPSVPIVYPFSFSENATWGNGFALSNWVHYWPMPPHTSRPKNPQTPCNSGSHVIQSPLQPMRRSVIASKGLRPHAIQNLLQPQSPLQPQDPLQPQSLCSRGNPCSLKPLQLHPALADTRRVYALVNEEVANAAANLHVTHVFARQ